MWRQYMNVIAEQAAGAVHIFDRFHVMKKLNEKINKVRAEVLRAELTSHFWPNCDCRDLTSDLASWPNC